jgi:hypothetical protein
MRALAAATILSVLIGIGPALAQATPPVSPRPVEPSDMTKKKKTVKHTTAKHTTSSKMKASTQRQ